MTTAQDKITEIIEKHVCGLKHPRILGAREAADAILAAIPTLLPKMIPPLVWLSGKDGRGFVALTSATQYGVFDEGNPRWYFVNRNRTLVWFYMETFEEAKAAANDHHRATTMAVFQTPTGEKP